MSERAMMLSGDENVPAMPLRDSEVNHLRRVLAWMRCKYMLDEDMQRGYVGGASEMVRLGLTTPEHAGDVITAKAAHINRCPAYVRQGVKMLTKALRDHERQSGVVDAPIADGARGG